MERRAKRKFTAEFRQDVVNLIEVGGRKAVDVARDFDIRVELIYRWLQLARSRTAGQDHTSSQEIRRLQKRLAEVEEERDILKKAVGIFTRRPLSGSSL
jgi:transposase